MEWMIVVVAVPSIVRVMIIRTTLIVNVTSSWWWRHTIITIVQLLKNTAQIEASSTDGLIAHASSTTSQRLFLLLPQRLSVNLNDNGQNAQAQVSFFAL